MNLAAGSSQKAARAEALLEAAVRLLELDENDLALAVLERAERTSPRQARVKRARAIALARLEKPILAAHALLEELALSHDDVEAFRTYLGVLDRVDGIRTMPEGSFVRRLLRRLDEGAGVVLPGRGRAVTLQAAAQHLMIVLERVAAFELAFQALADDTSRTLMLELSAFRALGDGRVQLPFDADGMLAFMRRAEAECLRERDLYPAATATGASIFGRCTVDRWDTAPLGLPLDVLTSVEQLAGFAHLREYELDRDGVRVGPRPGDVVIDGGACYGDTALWLAHRTGPAGRVFAFEFMPAHVEIFRRNMALNPALAGQVELITRALHRRSGLQLSFVDSGPGSRLEAGAGPVTTVTIDDLVRERGLERVDFIKLDIEGAELDALAGAEQTIRRHRPRLAICAYHKPEDLGVLPAWLHGLGLGYELRLAHFSPIGWDTVLFAEAPTSAARG
ncbi:MAG TPA: FkbM family methyltransferase [Anaeromyxobacter sp.]|nr:FkbM family methyltransferase [Anaeromyxobacter sp.]